MNDLAASVEAMSAELALLRAESEARKLFGRYMFLCDSPLPEPDMSDGDRARAIGALFSDDGVWEGVGAAHGGSFGRHVGPDEIAAHMLRFHSVVPRQVFNTHYVCSEQIHATAEGVTGNWVQIQPWVFEDGRSLLRSSRLSARFRPTEDGWRIAHYRTENLFIADLPAGWASTLIDRSILMQPATSL